MWLFDLFIFLIFSSDRGIRVEHLISKLEALHSIPDTAKNKQACACCLLFVFSHLVGLCCYCWLVGW